MGDPAVDGSVLLDVFRQLMAAVAALQSRTAVKCEPAASTLSKLALAVGARLSRPQMHDLGRIPPLSYLDDLY